jgi:acetylornithine deacetylase
MNVSEALGKTKELLASLVAFDTTSHKSNLPLVRFVADYLAQHGIEARLLPDANGEKANLFAAIGPADGAGVGLSGHTDVVPVSDQRWDSDPFKLSERQGKLYGRGTCDMKGFLACVLALAPDFKARRLKRPIHILFSYDEEVGCTGVRPMIDEFGKRLPAPAMVVVGEPTVMTVVDAHKGPVRWGTDVIGRASHSSIPHLGVNAISYATRLINELHRIERELRDLPPDDRFDPPWSTLQVTEIVGGTASNIVPQRCSFGWELRAVPGLDPASVERRLEALAETLVTEMRNTAKEAQIAIRMTGHIPAFAAEAASDAVDLALRLAGQSKPLAVSFATEAGLFHRAGASAVVCGPGSISEAHTANEFIAVSQLEACLAFLSRLADWAET